MTLESMLSELSHSEKLEAMDLLWRDLSGEPSKYVSPEWHERILADRLANPAPGKPLSLGEAKSEVKERLETEAGIHEGVYGLHRKLSQRFPFAIYYRVADTVVDVVAVLDCRRDPDATARRLGRTKP